MWDKNHEISPLEREQGYWGKDLEKVSFKTRMEDPMRHTNHRFRSRVGAWEWLDVRKFIFSNRVGDK